MSMKIENRTKFADYRYKKTLITGQQTTIRTWSIADSDSSVEMRYVAYDAGRTKVQTGFVTFAFDQSYVSGGSIVPAHEIHSNTGNSDVTFTISIGGGFVYLNATHSDGMLYTLDYEIKEVLAPSPPKIQMTISGLTGSQTWRGLGNGTHTLSPDYYYARTHNENMDYNNNEKWGFNKRPGFPYSTTGPYQSSEFDARIDFAANANPSYAATYAAFYVYQAQGSGTFTMIGAVNNWYGSPVYGPAGAIDMFGKDGLLQDRILMNSGTISGITFSWQRLPNQPIGIWQNY